MAMSQEEIQVVLLRLQADVSELNTSMRGAQAITSTAGSNMKTSLASVAKGIGLATAAAAVSFAAVNRLMRGMENLAQQYKIQEQAEKRLANNLGFVSKALVKQASDLQKVTRFGDEATLQAQSLIAGFIKEEDAILRLTPVIQDLAEAKGMDLASAADLVTKTIASGTNALSRYGIKISDTTDRSKRMEEVMAGIEKAYGGVARAVATTDTGKLDILNNQLSDIREELGKELVPIVNTWKQAWVEAGIAAVGAIQSIKNPIKALKDSVVGDLMQQVFGTKREAGYKPPAPVGGTSAGAGGPAVTPLTQAEQLAANAAATKASIEKIKGAIEELDRKYEDGKVTAEEYYLGKAELMQQNLQLEVAQLERDISGEEERTKRIEKRGEITQKQIALENELAALAAQTDTDKLASQQEALLGLNEKYITGVQNALRVYTAEVTTSLEKLDVQYSSGKISLDAYYAEKEALLQLQSSEEIRVLNALITATDDQAQKAEYLVQIKERELQLDRELAALRGKEVTDRQQVADATARQTEKNKRDAEAKQVEQDARLQQGISTISDITSGIQDIYAQYYDYVVQSEQNKMNAQIESARAAGASETELNALRTSLQAAANARAKKAWEKQKKADLASAIINTALAVVTALTDKTVPSTIARIALAAVAGVAGGFQIAKIASQTYPGMAEGGMVAQGTTGTADDVHARLSRGEYVTPAKSVDYYGAGVMEAMRRRAVPRELFAGVGSFAARRPSIPAFAEGGLVTSPAGAAAGGGGPTIVNFLDAGVMDRYLASIDGQRAIMNVISKRSYEARNALGVTT